MKNDPFKALSTTRRLGNDLQRRRLEHDLLGLMKHLEPDFSVPV